MKIKQIDRLILKGFASPFLMTFFVSLFVFIMQFLWKYIDEIMGKGLAVTTIFELIFYLSMSLVPLALPVSVLISSVMVMGNMGERYELASLKSAGISLSRIMSPLMIISFFVMIISFFVADVVIPFSNLKFQTRLYDIRRQKATLSLEEGIFNDDFKGFAIRVKEKGANEQDLEEVMIYDHTGNTPNPSQIIAKKGQMYPAGEQFMVMQLNEGTQYQELKNATGNNSTFPYMRIKFKSWRKVFDMGEFDMDKTDEEVFQNHHRMINSKSLRNNIDSLNIRSINAEESLLRKAVPFFTYLEIRDSIIKAKPFNTKYQSDTTVQDVLALLTPQKRKEAIAKAKTLVNRMSDYSKGSQRTIRGLEYVIVEHYNELYRKMSYAIACFIFLFIGAPMGAIVRKGGFGWPILISIIFFVLFLVLQLIGERLSEGYILPPFFGMFLPIFIIFPLGVYLTRQAMNDSKSMNVETYIKFFERIGNKFKRKK
ncbi:MAG: LptF/LptG family permease [Saprospiraceae bacterium]